MKKFIIGLLAVLLFATAPVIAGNMNDSNSGGFSVDANDKAVIAMLWMVYSDLQMCRTSLSQSAMENVSAIGHLNNAQSALRKTQLDPAYYTLVGEIDKRISKIKFYLVMNERRAVAERLHQLMMIIRNVLGVSGSDLTNKIGNGYTGYNPGSNNGSNNGIGYIPNGSGYVPVTPEVPVNGQMSPNPMPVLPSGVVPVR
ncbi:MAG: hypothetical protein EOM80_12165 [Erysipelotrichia bacterium]|nr:hypothetical protein [Erysipelotrichia bacterium]